MIAWLPHSRAQADTLGDQGAACPGNLLTLAGSPLEATTPVTFMSGGLGHGYRSTCSSDGADFVWRFVAPVSGQVTVTMHFDPAAFNGSVSVQAGICGGNGCVNTLACEDAVGTGSVNVTFKAKACTTYYLTADKRDSNTTCGAGNPGNGCGFTVNVKYTSQCACEGPNVDSDGDTTPDCLDSFPNDATKPGLGQGDPIDAAAELRMARCSAPGASECEAEILATANMDRRDAAKQYIAGILDVPQYLAIKVDRTRKLLRARHDPAYLTALCAGDADLDLVPNSEDDCPGTPPMTPTTPRGCTNTVLPKGPPRGPVDVVVRKMGILRNKNCEGAPVPVFVRNPVDSYCRRLADDEPNTYNLFLGRVENQPTDCDFWYEISAQLVGPDGARSYKSVAFLNSEEFPFAPTASEGLVLFKIKPSSDPARNAWAMGAWHASIRARAVNGNGVASAWSDIRQFALEDCGGGELP